MASFGDVTTIRTFIDPFTCVSPCVAPYGPDKIILSESKHLAVLYDLNTCLPTKCWTFSELDPLVSPFIYDHVNEKFIAVKQLKVALFKCDFEDDLVQIKLGKLVHCLIGSLDKESLVLFKNGNIRPLSCVIGDRGKTTGPDIIPKTEEIIKTIINQLSPEISWVALLTKTENSSSKLYLLKADLIKGEGELFGTYTIKQDYKCLTMRKNGQPLALTEDGRIELLVAGEQHLLTLHNCSVMSALCLPEEDTLAVVVHEDQTYILKIINLKYKVITSQLSLEIEPLPDFISQSNGNIFIASRKAMLCIQYEIKPASLASVMGKNLLPLDSTNTVSGTTNSLKRKASSSSDHIFLDSSTDIKLFPSSLNENITINELKKSLPRPDELLSEKAIFSALATILKSKCFSTTDGMCKEILDSVISRPFNHSFMVNVVKSANLTADLFVQIIDILIEMLAIENGYIIDWLIVILDSCLKLLLFTRTDVIKNTFKKLGDKLELMDESLEKHQEMSALLDDLLTSKTKLSINQMYKGVKHDKYCIEILEL